MVILLPIILLCAHIEGIDPLGSKFLNLELFMVRIGTLGRGNYSTLIVFELSLLVCLLFDSEDLMTE